MVQQSGPKSPQKTYVRVLRPCEHGPSRDGPKGVNARVTRRAIVIPRRAHGTRLADNGVAVEGKSAGDTD